MEEPIVIDDQRHDTPTTAVYCELGFSRIGKRDYLSLRDGHQINDEVINGMLHYQMRDRLDCHLFNTHFMTRYLRLSGTAEYKHRQVAGWTARRRINLANKTAITAVAMHFEKNHLQRPKSLRCPELKS